MFGTPFRLLCIAGLLSIIAFGARLAPAGAAEAYDPWPGLVQDIFNNRPMSDGSDVRRLSTASDFATAILPRVTVESAVDCGARNACTSGRSTSGEDLK